MRLPRAMRRWKNPLWQLFLANLFVLTRAGTSTLWMILMPVLLSVVLGIAYRGQDMPGGGVPIVVARTAEGDVLAERLAKVGGLKVERPDPTLAPDVAAALPLVSMPALAASSGPRLRYVDFLVPGLLGFAIMSQSMTLAFTLAFMRWGKLMRRLIATPMSRAHLLLSLAFARCALALFLTGFVLGAAALLHGSHVAGNVVTLGLFVLLGALAFCGIATLVGSRTEHQEVVGGISSLVTLGMLVGSGVFFPISNFPTWIQPPLRYLPMSVLADGLRAIVNEGATLAQVGPEIGVLAAYALVTFVIGLRVFRWT